MDRQPEYTDWAQNLGVKILQRAEQGPDWSLWLMQRFAMIGGGRIRDERLH